MNRITWIGRHEGMLRDVARGCAYGDYKCLKQGAKILSAFIPDGATIVPMPSHIGRATTMLDLCRWIKSFCSNVKIWNGLECDPHESSHIAKLMGGEPPEVSMYVKSRPPTDSFIIIDNTIASGSTANAALDAVYELGIGDGCVYNATVLAITKG